MLFEEVFFIMPNFISSMQDMTITKRGRGRPRGGRSCAQGRSSCETQVRNTVPISTLNPRDEMGGDSTEPPAMTEFPNARDNSPRNRNDIGKIPLLFALNKLCTAC
ncbi:hypothetical protein I3842_14G083100 [Carya illinoinensis]|uniref:Uncharacterized protein n=1 Tax=Carya illinoinensis TaxID=32201 RepID=A0A922DAR9_CARIL|nr:hypothetical protein I3842_14G083100 [Carya illinoinensis]